MKNAIAVISILVTLLVTVAYGKTTFVSQNEFTTLCGRLDSIEQTVRMILQIELDKHHLDEEDYIE